MPRWEASFRPDVRGNNAPIAIPDGLHVAHRRVWASLGAKATREILVGHPPCQRPAFEEMLARV